MSASSSDNAEPNLTPILDMVFQLITFFMLVATFKNAALDRDLTLPVVGSARPVESTGQTDSLVLNIRADGRLIVQGGERDLASFISQEYEASKKAEEKKNKNFKPGDELPTTIVIRADKTTPFHYVFRVVKAAQEKGFRKFTYLALDKPKTAPK